MSLLNRLKGASYGSISKAQQLLADSDFFNSSDCVPTRIPALNIALGGDVNGGIVSGLCIFAADSKHFKSNFCLQMVSAYLERYDDALCIFYDSEFGVTPAYLASMRVDAKRVLHIPITNIEELKFDLIKKLEEIKPEDHVIIMIDSIGNLASKKELEDAINDKSAADMTRAKALKSLGRMITPYLTIKQVPILAVNHVYETQEMYSKQIMSGGKGMMLSANTVFFISKAQDKDGTELKGYHFTLIAHKSRFVRENAKIPITVSFDNGIAKWSGMPDIAKMLGWLTMPSNGWYRIANPETGEIIVEKIRMKDLTESDEVWKQALDAGFNDAIKQHYQLGQKPLPEAIEHEEPEDDESDS